VQSRTRQYLDLGDLLLTQRGAQGVQSLHEMADELRELVDRHGQLHQRVRTLPAATDACFAREA